jgi:prefoldin subunit 5
MSISQNEYEAAKQKVEAFEKRQKQLDHVKKELTKHIDRFNRFKFRVDKDTKTVFFAGVIGYDLKVGIAKAKNSDVFDANIGKLIAIKKSLGENTRDVENLVERDSVKIYDPFKCVCTNQLATTINNAKKGTY